MSLWEIRGRTAGLQGRSGVCFGMVGVGDLEAVADHLVTVEVAVEPTSFPAGAVILGAAEQEEAGRDMPMKPSDFHRNIRHEAIAEAIRKAEAKTTGCIRLVVSPRHVDDVVQMAQAEFFKLGMDRSPGRNGVLIFVAPRSRRFAVIGDQAVHALCGDRFWQELTLVMSQYFQRGDFSGGLAHGLECAGELMAQHFQRPKT